MNNTLYTSFYSFLNCNDFRKLRVVSQDGDEFIQFHSHKGSSDKKITKILITIFDHVSREEVHPEQKETLKRFVEKALTFNPKILGLVKNEIFNRHKHNDEEAAREVAKETINRIEDTVYRLFDAQLIQEKQNYRQLKQAYRLVKEEYEQISQPNSHLSVKIENLAKIKELEEKKQIALENFRQAEYLYKTASVRFAQNLGIDFKAVSEGANGTYFGYDLRQRVKLVFKPGDEEQGAESNPKWQTRLKEKIKKIIGKIFPNFVSPKRTKSKSFLREVAASRVAQALAIDSVPRTEFESFASKKFHNLNEMLPKEGSCQLFCKSSGTADKVLGVPHFLPVWLQKIILAIKRAFVPFNREIDHQYLMNFQLLAIFDVLIKGYDRHGGNFMINKETQDVWIIDNGNSFSSSHLDDYLLSRHYLAFLMFEEARKEFCPEILEYIKRIAEKQEDLVGIVAEALRDDFTPEVEQVFRDNMRLLTTLIDTENFMNSPIKTPMDLGKYVTTRDFDRALGRNHPVAQPGSMILQEG